MPGHWGDCSVECGVGEQRQTMLCLETGEKGDSIYVDNELCERYSQKAREDYVRACVGEGENCPQWQTTEWSQVRVGIGFT